MANTEGSGKKSITITLWGEEEEKFIEKKKSTMSENHRAFCDEFLRNGGNQLEAVLSTHSEYDGEDKKSRKAASVRGAKLKKMDDVKEYLKHMRGKIQKKTVIDSAWVIEKAVKMVEVGEQNRKIKRPITEIVTGPQGGTTFETKKDSNGNIVFEESIAVYDAGTIDKGLKNIIAVMGMGKTDVEEENEALFGDYMKAMTHTNSKAFQK